MAERYFIQACGVSRFSWNWALARWQEKYKAGEKVSAFILDKEFNAIKHEQFPWTADVTKWASQKAIGDLGDAFTNFFKKIARYPKFKKKGLSHDSFYLGIKGCKITKNKLMVPKLGYVKMCQELRFQGTPKFVVISREAGEWFASITVEIDPAYQYPHQCKNQAATGVDLGIKNLATLSDGTTFQGAKSLKKNQKKLRKANKSVSRKKLGSKNRKKAVARLAKVHAKVKRVRQHYHHETTAFIVRNYRWIGLENLQLKRMMKDRRFAKLLADQSFYEFRRQLEYKSKLAGSNVIIADKLFPSSKKCSSCGFVLDKLELSERAWTCPSCGILHDRDINAAKNLENIALEYREMQNVCGENVSPVVRSSAKSKNKRQLSVKQKSKLNLKPVCQD